MKTVGQLFREKLTRRLKDAVQNNDTIFLMNYSHLTASRMSDFRKNLEKAGAEVFVSRNSLARLALKDLKYDALAERVQGQTAFVWSRADSVEVSKALTKFLGECENIHLKGGLLSGKLFEADDIKKIAELPSREVLLSILFGTIQAPLVHLANALNAKTRDLLSILKQLSEKKK